MHWMSAAFCYSQSLEAPRGYSAPRSADPVISFVHTALLATCIVCANANSSIASAAAAVIAPKLDPSALALLYNANFVSSHHFETISPSFLAMLEGGTTTTSATYWSISNPPAPEFSAMPSQAKKQIEAIGSVWKNAGAVDSIQYVRENHQLKNAAYQSSLSVLFITGLKLNRQNPELMGDTIAGVASWYNPYNSGSESPETETASGELYDPDAWTAAIQIKLRGQFGGVRYGRNYKPSYALVESGNKEVIVKINDVGPLKPGRVIDLSERTMRYFDRSLQLGLLGSIKVTPLLGEYWTPGPVGGEQLISAAVAQALDAGLVKNEGSATGIRLRKADMVTTTPLNGGESGTKPIGGEEPISDAAVQAWFNDPFSFAIDGSLVEVDASSHCGQTSNKIDWPFPECGNHAIAEFVSRLVHD